MRASRNIKVLHTEMIVAGAQRPSRKSATYISPNCEAGLSALRNAAVE